MKAIQLQAVNQLNLIEIAPPTIHADELLVRTGASTICTSDLNDIRENPFGIALPVVMGHEGAGTVVAVGEAVTGFAPGDRIAAHPVHPCGHCANCQHGMAHLCLNMGHFGLNRSGTFAEFFTVRADRARRIPSEMSFAVASLLEPVCVCLQALAQARLVAGNRLLILGDGPFGVLMARLARCLSLETLVIAGMHDFRLSLAHGAMQVNVLTQMDSGERLREWGGDIGYDAVILAVASAAALRQGQSLLRAKGRLVFFAAMSGETPMDLFDVHLRELELVGACNDEDRLDEALALLSDPSLALEALVTHLFPIESFREALKTAADRQDEALKVALTFDA